MKEKDITNSDTTNYNVSVNISIWDHIEKQVAFNKSTNDKSYSKRRWILDSVIEKLSSVSAKDIILENKKSISFAITNFMLKKIEKVISFYRKFDPTYSKNQFFMDAISEKVEKEQKASKSTLKSSKELEDMLEKLISNKMEAHK